MAALGIEFNAATTWPALVKCPHCDKLTLYLYEDNTEFDLWLDCLNCSAHGNIITFAADIWKVEWAEAIDKFDALGIHIIPVSERSRRLNRCQRQVVMRKFWNVASEQLWAHGDAILAAKLMDMGLSAEIPCSGFIGAATAEQVEALYFDMTHKYPKRMSRRRPFLVFPYEDLPNRLSGVLLFQYYEEFDFRRVFCGTNHGKVQILRDVGYFMLRKAVHANNAMIKNTQFMFDDPIWAVKAQMVQLRHGLPLLPICASYSGDTVCNSLGRLLAGCTNSRRFFYAKKISPDVVSQAVNSRSYICETDGKALPRPKSPQSTLKLLSRICGTAKTWKKTLELGLTELPTPALNDFISRLTIPVDKLREFARSTNIIDEATAAEINTGARYLKTNTEDAGAHYRGSVNVNGDTLINSKSHVVCNCVPVIEKIVYTEENRYYIGHVRKSGKVYPFSDSAEVIDRHGLLEYVAKILAKHGELAIFGQYYNFRATEIIVSLYPPEIVNITTTPGWNEDLSEFCCGSYAIVNSGEIKALPELSIRLPGQIALPEPNAIAPESVYELLTVSAENAMIWAIVSTVIANMLAPGFNKDQQGICVIDSVFPHVSEILTKLKAHDLSRGNKNTWTPQQMMDLVDKTSNWPAIIETIAADSLIGRTLINCQNKPAYLAIKRASKPAALSYGWEIIDGPTLPPGTNYDSIPYVVTAYLSHAIRHRAALSAKGKELSEIILIDLHSWLMHTYNHTFNLERANKYIWRPGTEHIALMEEIINGINDELISLLPSPRRVNSRGAFIVRDKEGWWLNRPTINKYFKHLGVPEPNWLGITHTLAKTALLIEERTICNIPGLLVNRDWCDKFFKYVRVTDGAPESDVRDAS